MDRKRNEYSLKVGGKPNQRKKNKNMSKIINGKKYMLVDVIFDEDLIYDIYEDEEGNRIKIAFECLN